MTKQTLFEDFVVRCIKVLDIGWSAVAYFVLAMLTLYILNKLFVYNDEVENKKSTLRLIIEMLLYIWLIGVFVYMARNVYPIIPWPFENVYGYEHLKTKEVTNAAFYGTFVILFNTNLQKQFNRIRERLDNIFGTKHIENKVVIVNQDML